jgi:hypothetical protein
VPVRSPLHRIIILVTVNFQFAHTSSRLPPLNDLSQIPILKKRMDNSP